MSFSKGGKMQKSSQIKMKRNSAAGFSLHPNAICDTFIFSFFLFFHQKDTSDGEATKAKSSLCHTGTQAPEEINEQPAGRRWSLSPKSAALSAFSEAELYHPSGRLP